MRPKESVTSNRPKINFVMSTRGTMAKLLTEMSQGKQPDSKEGIRSLMGQLIDAVSQPLTSPLASGGTTISNGTTAAASCLPASPMNRSHAKTPHSMLEQQGDNSTDSSSAKKKKKRKKKKKKPAVAASTEISSKHSHSALVAGEDTHSNQTTDEQACIDLARSLTQEHGGQPLPPDRLITLLSQWCNKYNYQERNLLGDNPTLTRILPQGNKHTQAITWFATKTGGELLYRCIKLFPLAFLTGKITALPPEGNDYEFRQVPLLLFILATRITPTRNKSASQQPQETLDFFGLVEECYQRAPKLRAEHFSQPLLYRPKGSEIFRHIRVWYYLMINSHTPLLDQFVALHMNHMAHNQNRILSREISEQKSQIREKVKKLLQQIVGLRTQLRDKEEYYKQTITSLESHQNKQTQKYGEQRSILAKEYFELGATLDETKQQVKDSKKQLNNTIEKLNNAHKREQCQKQELDDLKDELTNVSKTNADHKAEIDRLRLKNKGLTNQIQGQLQQGSRTNQQLVRTLNHKIKLLKKKLSKIILSHKQEEQQLSANKTTSQRKIELYQQENKKQRKELARLYEAMAKLQKQNKSLSKERSKGRDKPGPSSQSRSVAPSSITPSLQKQAKEKLKPGLVLSSLKKQVQILTQEQTLQARELTLQARSLKYISEENMYLKHRLCQQSFVPYFANQAYCVNTPIGSSVYYPSNGQGAQHYTSRDSHRGEFSYRERSADAVGGPKQDAFSRSTVVPIELEERSFNPVLPKQHSDYYAVDSDELSRVITVLKRELGTICELPRGNTLCVYLKGHQQDFPEQPHADIDITLLIKDKTGKIRALTPDEFDKLSEYLNLRDKPDSAFTVTFTSKPSRAKSISNNGSDYLASNPKLTAIDRYSDSTIEIDCSLYTNTDLDTIISDHSICTQGFGLTELIIKKKQCYLGHRLVPSSCVNDQRLLKLSSHELDFIGAPPNLSANDISYWTKAIKRANTVNVRVMYHVAQLAVAIDDGQIKYHYLGTISEFKKLLHKWIADKPATSTHYVSEKHRELQRLNNHWNTCTPSTMLCRPSLFHSSDAPASARKVSSGPTTMSTTIQADSQAHAVHLAEASVISTDPTPSFFSLDRKPNGCSTLVSGHDNKKTVFPALTRSCSDTRDDRGRESPEPN